MHTLNRAPITIAFLALLVFASTPRNLAIAHEGHQMECKKTSMQAIKADIQAMTDGEAKTVAMKEMKMAEEMMDKKDMNACKTHMHNAMMRWTNRAAFPSRAHAKRLRNWCPTRPGVGSSLHCWVVHRWC
jgi:hypothetical protein